MMSSAGSGIINQGREKTVNGLRSSVFGLWSTVVAEADPGALKGCSMRGFLGCVCWVHSCINREIERDQGDRVRENRE